MPLIYLPLIMYAGWMEFMLQPLRHGADRTFGEVQAAPVADCRAQA
ncbi:MAG TPA: hypothetical protein VLX44_09145 [Xanthobacteraceae bacterium]|nr:hypothetical protein [Xanthobacteraceae bacterium]